MGKLLILIGVALSFGLNVAAQQDANQTSTDLTLDSGQEKVQSERIEKIEVTGSHIKRTQIDGPSPVLIIDREQIDKSGYNSIADVLRDLTENSQGSAREHTGSVTADIATVNLRGLGSKRSLVLLNGKRLPADPVAGAVDLHLIPMAAVERIDILKDGASATYGSDALGGVVNIITKQNFDTSTVGFKYFQPGKKGGTKSEIFGVSGFSTAKTSVIGVFNYQKNDRLYRSDREHASKYWSTSGSSDPATTRIVGKDGKKGLYRSDNCPDDRKLVSAAGVKCKYNVRENSTLLPDYSQLTGMVIASHDISDSVTLFGTASAVHKESEWQLAPGWGTYVIPASQAEKTNYPGLKAGESIEVKSRFTELGNRVERSKTDSMTVTGGAKGILTSLLDWEVSAGFTDLKKRLSNPSGYGLKSKIKELYNTSSQVPYDFVTATSSQRTSDFDSTRYEPYQEMRSTISQVEAKVTGEIIEIKSGAIAAAVGVAGTNEDYFDRVDPETALGNVNANAGTNGKGSRATKSVFTELSIPATESLEIQLSARHDSYSDFGSSTNPKVALKYVPHPSVLLRASTGTGFKAPAMQDLYATGGTGFPGVIDHVKCKEVGGDACAANGTEVEWLGGRDLDGNQAQLREETSQYWNLGAVWEPNKTFNIGVDVWQIVLNNLIDVDYNAITLAESKGVNPKDYGVDVIRNAKGEIEKLRVPSLNLSKQDVQGVDVGVNTQGYYKGYRLSAGNTFGYTMHFKNEGFPGAGFGDRIDDYGKPRWKNIVSLGLAPNSTHDFGARMHTTASHKKSNPTKGRISQYNVYDFQYNYSGFRNARVTLGVKNLFDSIPPLDDSNPNALQVAGELYDQVGRLVYVGYSHVF